MNVLLEEKLRVHGREGINDDFCTGHFEFEVPLCPPSRGLGWDLDLIWSLEKSRLEISKVTALPECLPANFNYNWKIKSKNEQQNRRKKDSKLEVLPILALEYILSYSFFSFTCEPRNFSMLSFKKKNFFNVGRGSNTRGRTKQANSHFYSKNCWKKDSY